MVRNTHYNKMHLSHCRMRSSLTYHFSSNRVCVLCIRHCPFASYAPFPQIAHKAHHGWWSSSLHIYTRIYVYINIFCQDHVCRTETQARELQKRCECSAFCYICLEFFVLGLYIYAHAESIIAVLLMGTLSEIAYTIKTVSICCLVFMKCALFENNACWIC